MRITTRMMFETFVSNLNNNETRLNKLSNQVTTGKKFFIPSDDPVDYARSMTLNSQLNDVAQFTSNASSVTSWLKATDDSLSSVITDMQSVNDLVNQGSTDTLTQDNRNAIAEQIDQIRNGLMQTANTNVGNRYIFSGAKVTQPAYNMRTVVASDARDLLTQPITINQSNNQIQIKLDDQTPKTINLTSAVYDGSTGKTMADMAKDIQNQLNKANFTVPVSVKVTPDNRLEFYAGATPPDGTNHSLVLLNGSALKTSAQVPAATTADKLILAANSNTTANYYANWTVKITGGTGVGESRTITSYDGPTQTVTGLDSNWSITPDSTSQYTLTPPMQGNSTVTNGTNTITLPANASSAIDNFYNGMSITVNGSSGTPETIPITAYDATTHIATLASNWSSPTGNYNYSITPNLSGAPQNASSGPPATITLNAAASGIDNIYNGISISITNANGTQETRKVISYDGTTKTATLDGGAWNTVPSPTSSYQLVDSTLSQLGFNNQASTKQVVGTSLTAPVQILGKYPESGITQVPSGPPLPLNQAELAGDTNGADNYYNGWTMTITKGTGVGQTMTVNSYTGASHTATLNGNWTVAPDATSEYTLTPPTVGTVPNAVGPNQLKLAANASASDDFYNGMTLTIYNGSGQGQTRTITGYDAATQTVTLDQPWSTVPDTSSSYAINANNGVSQQNTFKIKVGSNPSQEIYLDSGNYSLTDLAKELQSKIQERGGQYQNVQVTVTSENQLRFVYQNPDINTESTPDIELDSGSNADVIMTMGFQSGTHSDTPVMNYEGDQGQMQTEINFGTKMSVNTVGDKVFDPIFTHLTQISQDLRTGNIKALGNQDLTFIKDDIQRVSISQGDVGAKTVRLQTGLTRLSDTKDNITTLLTGVEDVDAAQAILDYKTQQTAYQAALQVGAQLLPKTLMDYLK